ncbi:6-carboxytetrahydropterin synthase [Corallincola platygyrae]|uniref:6-carboxy-5,6,7,8-tetrahydropterin synthase n=1 Tax=Corallincola platygyrae TaxID=1193278 RepID=A0ABW4XIT3_9GAMM
MRLFVDGLTVIDSTYLCPSRGLLGESWIVDVELQGELNDEGMVFDFSHVKKTIKASLDLHIDHKLIVPMLSPAANVEQQSEEVVTLSCESGTGAIYVQSPLSAYALLPLASIDDDSLARYLEEMLLKLLPENVKGLTVNLRHETEEKPFYHYTHGLKLHDGNCQRIAHGHRSRIGIWVDGVPKPELEAAWAKRWHDIYLGSEDDLVSSSDTPFASNKGIEDSLCFAYSASQGDFFIAVPKAQTEIVDCESTVECLSDYICRQLSEEFPEKSIKVRAYEGVEKGAITERTVD